MSNIIAIMCFNIRMQSGSEVGVDCCGQSPITFLLVHFDNMYSNCAVATGIAYRFY